MTWLPVVLWLLPAVAGLTLWLLPGSFAGWRPLALLCALAELVLAITLLSITAGGTVLGHAFGGWQPPFGIVFAADRLSALLVLLNSLLLVVTVWRLRGESHGRRNVERAVPLLFLLSSGLVGAFQTGDLFNLFVAFEVVLLASYALLQVPGTERSRRAAFPNIAINLLASLFFFIGVALMYGRLGTVNLADIATQLAGTPTVAETVAITLLTVAFGIKAGLVPLLFWLPASYPTTSGPIAAFFAGMMTKLGVFALLRMVPLLAVAPLVSQTLVWVGVVSALVGGLAALSEYELRRLLGFHIVSQVGYMILGLGLLTTGAVAAAIFYLTHHILVKATLFCVADELERRNGSRDLRKMTISGSVRTALVVLFLVAAFSLAGLPPFSGFFAKLGLFHATFAADAWVPLAALAAASVVTLASMLKIWRLAFADNGDPPPRQPARNDASLAPVWMLVTASVVLALLAGPSFRFAEATAQQLLSPPAHVATVESPGSAPGELTP